MSNPATAVTDEKTGNRKYPYPPTGEMWWSATTVLGGTEDKPWLPGWAARIAAQNILGNLRAFAGVRQVLGIREAVRQATSEAELIRGIKRDTGGYVHKIVESLVYWAEAGADGKYIALPDLPGHLRGALYDDIPVEQVADWMIQGWLNFVADFNPRFLAAEMTVFHPGLKIAGTLDSIMELPGLAIGRAGRFVPADGDDDAVLTVDVKTGKYLSVTWPEQIAIYRRCPECLVGPGEIRPTPKSKAGAVVHLRPPTEPGYERGYKLMLISGADDEAAWRRAQAAAEIWQGRAAARDKPGKVCYPLRADGTVQQPRLADLDGEGYGRILSPLVKAGVADLEQLAAMQSGQLLHTRGIKDKTLNGIRVMLADHGLSLANEPVSAGCGYCRAGHPERCAGPWSCGMSGKAAA